MNAQWEIDEKIEELDDQQHVVNAALEAFWQSIAESCPYIKTCDLDPMTFHNFHVAATKAVATWLVTNAASEEMEK